jgi:hypothetical protein
MGNEKGNSHKSENPDSCCLETGCQSQVQAFFILASVFYLHRSSFVVPAGLSALRS